MTTGGASDFHERIRQYQSGRLVFNVMHFGRLLRAAGLPVGPNHLLTAVETLDVVGVQAREDVFWALHAAFVKRREEEGLFKEAFDLFWQDPYGGPDAMSLLLPHTTVPQEEARDSTSRRLSEAWKGSPPKRARPVEPEADHEFDATFTYSDIEVFKAKDFEQMSADEVRKAKALIKRMRMPHLEQPTRRLAAKAKGLPLDMRRMMRASLRTGGRDIPLAFRDPTTRPPPMVVICDISGSMERYSRMFLHFLHALSSDRERVSAFVFGTRLTNISRWLKARDVDQALAQVGKEVQDWSGGTRIEACLRDFNLRWSRRVLSQNAITLLVTDGLDRGPSLHSPTGPGTRPSRGPLGLAVQRLRKSCRRLVWLNPLLRYDDFEPVASGVQAILPNVDDFRAVHNLSSLEELVRALEAPIKARSI